MITVKGACLSGKVGYLDRFDAEWQLLDLKIRDRDEANVYQCTSCDLFHLTSGPAYDD